MKNFLKLTSFEFHRLSKILAVLLLLVVLVQVTGMFIKSNEYMKLIDNAIYVQGLSEEQAAASNGKMSFGAIRNSAWFNGPIFVGAAAVFFYIFLIWYRDWFGKNTFIYRLLMLPTERINVFFAKLATILMMTLSFIAVQLLAILIEMQMMKMIVPDAFRIDTTVREVLAYSIDTSILFPLSLTNFIFSYAVGIIFVAAVFTAVLMERSFRFKGIVLGVIYVIFTVFLFLSPLYVQDVMTNGFFYPDEIALLLIFSGLSIFALSTYISAWLLNNKINV